MTIKPIITTAIVAGSVLAALSGNAFAGGNYYGSHQSPYGGHSHVELGPADANEDFAFYDCKWLKNRALDTDRRSHWRAYRKCVRQYGQ